ncbi:hypothetical protein CGH67_24365, partial [Vibrio parahaemolyticus]
RRLTRQEWTLEKSASKRLSITLNKIKRLDQFLNQKEKLLTQTHTKNNNYKRGTYNELSK